MNKLIFSAFSVLLISVLFIFSSCEKDDSLDKLPVNEWIYNTMKENYYWNEDMPDIGQVNANAKQEEFFDFLLSNKDGKTNEQGNHTYYSYIEKDITTRSGSSSITYGFKPAYRFLDTNPYNIYMAVKYVLSGSPAEKAGLKRGDWVSHYNGIQLTVNNFKEFHNYTGSMTLTVGKLTRNGLIETRNVKVDAAITMQENPILVDTTYLINNKKIGYLMYNSFVSGPESDTDKTYDNELRSVFSKFAGHSPDEFILDLRYNSGGLLSCAQLLATMLAPQSALNQKFCKLIYNKSLNKTVEYKLDRSNIENGGANLNLDHLYIITSHETASSSELIINGLKPYMKIVLLGDTTTGKNVGSNEFSGKAKNYPWILHPITCLVENSVEFSDYSKGFAPDYKVDDAFDSELGNTKEYMLSYALQVIQAVPPHTFRSTELSNIIPLPQPHKGPRAIIIK